MRNKPFLYYEDWLILFGKDRTTSELAKARKKRVRPAVGISQGLSEMAVSFGAFFENTNNRMAKMAHRIRYSHDLSQQRRLVNTELLKLPTSTGQRLKVASMIVKDEEWVDLFFSLE
ncbi:hypothetical protein ACSBR1_024162 [Camellia fascicularis]